MMRLLMLAGGDSSQNAMLPLLMMQRNDTGNGDTQDGDSDVSNRQMLDALVYKPHAERILLGYAEKIQRMNDTQKARMYAALVLSLLGSTETGELGAAMRMCVHTQLNELFGDPMSGVYSTQASPSIYETRKDVPIGGAALGYARRPPSETVQEIELATLSGGNNGTKKGTVTQRNKPKNMIVV